MKWSPKYNWVGLSIHPLHNTNTTVKQHSLASFLFIVQTVVRPEIKQKSKVQPPCFFKKKMFHVSPTFCKMFQSLMAHGIEFYWLVKKNEISWSFLQKTPQKAKLARDHVHPPGHPWKLTAGTSKIHPNESRKVIFQTKRTKWMVYNGKPYWNGWFGDTIIFENIHIFIANPSHSWLQRVPSHLTGPVTFGPSLVSCILEATLRKRSILKPWANWKPYHGDKN